MLWNLPRAGEKRFLLIFTDFSAIMLILKSMCLRGLYAGASGDEASGNAHERVLPIRQEEESIYLKELFGRGV